MPEVTVTRQLPISIKKMDFATGTWTFNQSSGVVFMSKSAADETSTITIPIHIPRRNDQYGARLKEIKFPYRATTANLDAVPSVTLYRNEFDLVVAGATGDAAATAVTTTNDGVVTANAKDRLLTITVSSPEWDFSTESLATYTLVLGFNCGATTVLRAYSAFAIYDELV